MSLIHSVVFALIGITLIVISTTVTNGDLSLLVALSGISLIVLSIIHFAGEGNGINTD